MSLFESISWPWRVLDSATHIDNRGTGGGFSGAVIVRVECAAGMFCLRGWPSDSLPRLRILGLHRLLAHAARQGVPEVPVPIPDAQGRTLIERDGKFWQLESWMPGTADYWQNPRPERLSAAMECLSRWHRAAAAFVPNADEAPWFGSKSLSPSPAVVERLEQIRRWDPRKRALVRQLLPHAPLANAAIGERLGRILSLFERFAPAIEAELERFRLLSFSLQPCLRDVWHDHVLFTGDRVTGLIDASACRAENVAADLARLLGSLVGNDARSWEFALNEYQKHRRLTLDELGLMAVLDRSGVLLSGMTWLDWLCLQQRTFAAPERISERLARIVGRMERLG